MPITKSAQKARRQNIKKNKRNARQKSKLRDILKKVRFLVLQKQFDEAKKILPTLYKAFDKAAKTGLIKKNTAARIKSRISRMIK